MLNLTKIPQEPGCYIFKNKNKKIIYIGKAKNLKKRVSSYFTRDLKISDKTSVLVSNISSIDYIVTTNELEALILENTLIKKHKPKYNVELKTGERYAYIQITNESYPRLLTLREKTEKNKDVFGPFVSGQSRVEIIKFLNKEFKLRTCKRLPKTPCVRYHIGYCSAPCINNITKEEYNKNIDTVKKILSGKITKTLYSLKTEMQEESKNQNYERALILREQINAIEYLKEKQKMERDVKFDQDIINFLSKEDKSFIFLFNIDKGTLINKKEHIINNELIDFSVLDDFVIKYYSNNYIPKEIITPDSLKKETKEYIEKIKKEKIIFTVPKQGEKKELLFLCLKNIENAFFKNENTLEDLQKKLKLKNYPRTIECFDVSHFYGEFTVGAMVSFIDGAFSKKNYRRFKIKNLDKGKIDDYSSISEIVKRRYTRVIKEKKELPNLIVIDGGKGQLSVATSVLKDLNILDKIDIISLAEKEEEIFKPEEIFSIKLSKKEPSLQLLQKIRDEAHRFAISYNKQLRSKKIK